MSKAKSSAASKNPGRPRSERARQAILKAARDFIEELGPTRLTVEGVASRAGVGKPTIYRHWANAQELAMAAFVDLPDPQATETVGTSTLDDLRTLLRDMIARLDSRRGRQMALMLAGAEPESELFKAFSNRVMMDGRRRGAAILDAVKARGEIRDDVDTGLCLDLIFGAVFLRLLLDHAPLGDALADDAIALVLKGALDPL
tara:strand:- start:4019 stop:4624 length:606 start_codon:yes stop_codon:yes gene_type:complete